MLTTMQLAMSFRLLAECDSDFTLCGPPTTLRWNIKNSDVNTKSKIRRGTINMHNYKKSKAIFILGLAVIACLASFNYIFLKSSESVREKIFKSCGLQFDKEIKRNYDAWTDRSAAWVLESNSRIDVSKIDAVSCKQILGKTDVFDHDYLQSEVQKLSPEFQPTLFFRGEFNVSSGSSFCEDSCNVNLMIDTNQNRFYLRVFST
jgi:hypothetical protein